MVLSPSQALGLQTSLFWVSLVDGFCGHYFPGLYWACLAFISLNVFTCLVCFCLVLCFLVLLDCFTVAFMLSYVVFVS